MKGVMLCALLWSGCACQLQAAAIRATDDPVRDERPVTEEDRRHWAYQTLQIKAGATLDSLAGPAMGMAERALLIRRVCLDLTGLPPREADLAKDYETLVDSLLASPAYGEHWAQRWLDLARFAETDGFEYDADRPRAWQYRDWVIAALNRDLPFDEFVRQQLAGDLLPGGDPAATGFLMAAPDMPDLNSQDERRHVLLNDITSTVGTAGLGLTLGCAQCHDHPHDPVSQADFYRLRAFFDNTIQPKERKPIGPEARVFTEGVPVSRVFIRGDFRRPGPAVPAAYPRFLGTTPQGADRADLARWLTDEGNVLFLRATANRLWQQHFGRPLSEVPGDLGVQGRPPENPALLDWLAAELPRQGWSLKRLHKVIVMSKTYRQAGLAPRRLTGEMLRDAMLSVSGRLNPKAGGPGVRLPLPAEVGGTLIKKQGEAHPDPAEHDRRSIYAFARRNLRLPMFELFDRPDAQSACARRNESTTAPQALMLINSGFAQDCARSLAASLSKQHGSEARALITAATRRCLARLPSEAELDAGAVFLEQQTERAGGFNESLADYCLALMNSNEFVFVD